MSKKAHILAMRAGGSAGSFLPKLGMTRLDGAIGEAIDGDLWIGPRQALEEMACENPEIARMAKGVGDVMDAVSKAVTGKTLGDANPLSRYGVPKYLQIIPYILFRDNGKYLRYLRPSAGGDVRLHGRISIGIGGHIDLPDIMHDEDGAIDLAATLQNAADRENDEEIGIKTGTPPKWVATLYANDTEVDTLHLGIVGIYDLTPQEVVSLKPNEEIGDMSFKTLSEIASEVGEGNVLETWTRMIVEANPIA